jgi:HSP20 family protein
MANETERSQRGLTRRESDMPTLRPFSTAGILSPFALLREMTDWMDQAFESGGDRPIRRGERTWAPAIEVTERENNLVVRADLPGIDPKDVRVEVDNGMLVIQGERKREESEEREGMRRSERFYGMFFRAVPLPEKAKTEQAKADVRNGVLEVTIPVEQTAETRRQIPVSGQSQQAQGTSVGQTGRSSQQTQK